MAEEGLNGTVSGVVEACKLYMDTLHSDPRFAAIDFKIDEVDEPSFHKNACPLYKSEIVYSGLRDPNSIDPQKANRQTPGTKGVFSHER